MQFDPVSILHLVLCATFLVYIALRARRHGSLTLFHVSSFAYCAIALTFYPLVATDPWTIVNAQTIRSGFLVALIFVSLCVIADILFYTRKASSKAVEYTPRSPSLAMLVGIYLFGLIGFLRFYFVAGGFRHVGEVFRLVRSGEQYYDVRERIGSELMSNTGSGVAWGTSSVYVIMPVVVTIGFFVFRRSQNKVFLLLAVLSIIQAVLTELVFMERAPMLYVLVFPIVAWFAVGKRGNAREKTNSAISIKKLSLGGIGFTGLAIFIYSWTNTGENPLWSLFNRVFVMPCITANYYLATFPDTYGFRGWTHIFQMGASLGGDDVGTRDIYSFVTQGLFFSHPNSGILPTAYSGGGLPACAVITIIYLIIVVTIDSLFRRVQSEYRLINILINLFSMFTLANSPLAAALYCGFAIPSVLLFVYLTLCRRHTIGKYDSIDARAKPARKPRLVTF